MTFASAIYLLFLLAMVVTTRALPSVRMRQGALLIASALFYLTWGAFFLFVLAVSAAFNLLWGRLLRRRPTTALLWAGLGANIAVLALFKYAGALAATLGAAAGPAAGWLMPVGISFWTFQAMSWLIDIYRGHEDDPTAVEFFLYLSFWPTVLSGPVCRLREMLPQFRREERPSGDDLAEGARRIAEGLFLKMVVADTLSRGLYAGEGVAFGFDRLTSWSGIDVVFLMFGFGFQLYFDFAGYSSIAIGSARLLGIRLRENFDDPYLSRTPTEFWTRWHMSLSSWIRDYLFFPLATLRPGLVWRNAALVIAMTLFGVWHGVGATFLLWGLYQGVLLVAHRQVQALRREDGRPRVPAAVLAPASWLATFLLVSFGWILFRSNGLGQATAMAAALVQPAGWMHLSMRPNYYLIVLLAVAGYFLLAVVRRLAGRFADRPALARAVWLASPAYYAVILLGVIIWSRLGSSFVYFQF